MGRWNFSEGGIPKFYEPLDLVDQREDKADSLSSLTRSGGIISVRLGSTRVVDLELRGFDYRENRSEDFPKVENRKGKFSI
jgi:hypothetical protein